MTTDTSSNLADIIGNLHDAYLQFVPDSILTSAQLFSERRHNINLQKNRYYTADFAFYSLEDSVPYLYLGSYANPIFGNIGLASSRLQEYGGKYCCNSDEILKIHTAFKLGWLSKIEMYRLNLKTVNKEQSYFEVGTEYYDSMNKDQRLLVQGFIGTNDEFSKNMLEFNALGIPRIRVNVVNPTYIQRFASFGPFARACKIDSFEDSYLLCADVRNVGRKNTMRGIPLTISG